MFSLVFLASGFVGAGAAGLYIPETVNGSFSIHQVRNLRYKPHGPTAMAKAYMKYGAQMPRDLIKAMAAYHSEKLQKREYGISTTTPEYGDTAWLTPVQIGTPAQTLNLDFDSGSSDLWVFSSLQSSENIYGQTPFNIADSSTAVEVADSSWNVSYGDGSSSSGIVYSDIVKVGPLSVGSQGVEVATRVSTQFASDSENDGLLGLGFSKINSASPRQLTWFDNVKSQLDSPVWTADLKADAPGSYTFGAIDNNKYTGKIAYTTVSTAEGYWAFTASGYRVGASETRGQAIKGVADTGSSLLLVPEAVVKAYYARISGVTYDADQGGHVFPCSATLPDFTLYIGTAEIVIPGSFFNFSPVDDADIRCFGGIQANTGIGISIFGGVALKAAFVVFEDEGASPRLGWANKNLAVQDF
ncbi:hypothetical protein TruAng_004008 [Truncatella angustata]|nr:hypothetical protein TruAng_004008 [Truncatella angustata]